MTISIKESYLDLYYKMLNLINENPEGVGWAKINLKCNLSSNQSKAYLANLYQKDFIRRDLNLKYHITLKGRTLLVHLTVIKEFKTMVDKDLGDEHEV